ncbi:MAG: M1 family aminopeptidase [Deltaproteobacteria bacterium]|nr:M1 family aminopeptidase [Deltaproteobacteria bacterium]
MTISLKKARGPAAIVAALLFTTGAMAGATSASTSKPMSAAEGRKLVPAPSGLVGGRLPSDVKPTRQSVALSIDPKSERYSGVVVIDVELAAPRQVLWLHARGLEVSSAEISSGGAKQSAAFKIVDDVDGVASLTVAKPVAKGPATLTLSFSAKFHDDLDAIYRVKAGDDWYVFTQFEPLAAREAFPCFDEPAFKIPFTVEISHPEDVLAVANTDLTPESKVPHKKLAGAPARETWVTKFMPTKPLPTYLLALAVGPLDVVDGAVLPPAFDRAFPLKLRALTVKGKGALVARTLKDAATVLVAQEKMFGIGYPYDKLDMIAVPDFSAGAMENAGLITYRDTLLFVDDKSPIGAQKGSLNVIAHEQAHQWFGNLVTMAWWDDLWLNEAFATWFAARTVHSLRPDFDGNLDLRETAAYAMGEDSLVSARQIREPILSRGDINNAFDGITYSKGAGVIAMFEEYIDRAKGKGTFMKGVSAYLEGHHFGSGTTPEFLAAISAAADIDIDAAFSTFLDQPGVPLVQASCSANAAAKEAPTMTFSSTRFLPIGSTGDRKKKWDIPVCVSFLQQDGGRKPQVKCTMLTGGAGTLELPGTTCPKAVHPNADGGGYYRFAMPGPQLKALSTTLVGMTAGERLSFAAALRAGFATADVSYADSLAAAVPLATDVEVSVAFTPLSMLGFAREEAFQANATGKAAVNQRIVGLYQPSLNKLGFVDRKKDTPRDKENRGALFGVLVDAEGPPLAMAINAGREIFETSTTKQLANDLWPAALVVAVEHGKIDAAQWDAWLKKAKAQPDPRVRSWMLGALASTKDPALTKKALELVFDMDLRVNEAAVGMWRQANDHATLEGAFTFVTTRWDDVTKRLPEDWRPGLAGAFSGFCSEEGAKKVEAFFAPKVPTIPGLQRALAQTLEENRLCAARKAAHLESIRKTFPN